ncbi:MAG: cupin domain-containing protein [Chitinispirillaceae bacterium]
MKTVNYVQQERFENPHGVDARMLLDNHHAQVILISLQPGESLKKHVTPVDVFFYILQGTGVVEIGDEQQEVGPETLVDSPAKIPHRWRNEGTEVCRIMVVKTPRPQAKTRML